MGTRLAPSLWERGLAYGDYRASIANNGALFDEVYANPAFQEDDLKLLRALPPLRVVAVGEDWCPDVFRGLPVLQRMAEAAGWDLRAFPRDENLDIMGEFLKHGEHQSIPTAVFYTKDHDYIAHWSERPAKADAEMGEIGKLFEDLDAEKDRKEMRRRYDEFQQGPIWGSWRDATIEEITTLLQEKCA